MRIRLICLLCLLTVAAATFAVPVSAEENGSAYIDVSLIERSEEQGTVTVRFALNGLRNTDGAGLIEAHIGYDETALTLLSVSANHPDIWDFKNGKAEDWTKQQTDEQGSPVPEIYFVVMNFSKNLVKEDNVLYCDAVFRVLKQEDILSFDLKKAYYSTYIGNSLVRVDLDPKTLSLTIGNSADASSEPEQSDPKNPSAASSSESADVSDDNPDTEPSIIEEKPFDPDKLFKILIGVGAAVLALAAGAIIYHYRKKNG